MAVGFGTTNTDRFYTVAESDRFHLPNGDWTLLAIVKNSSNTNPYYISHGGGFGTANSYHLFCDIDDGGFLLKVDTLVTAEWGLGAPTLEKWAVVYGTRRGSNIYCGAGYVGEPGSVSEGAGVAIASGYTPTGLLKIGIRSNETSAATPSMKGSISDTLIIPGVSFNLTKLKHILSNGDLTKTTWWDNRALHGYLEHAGKGFLVDLTRKHVLVRNGTGYSRNTEEIDPPLIKRFKKNSIFSAFVIPADEGGGGPAEISATRLPLTGVGV